MVCVVPTVLDLTVGFTCDSAEPTLVNIIQGRRCSFASVDGQHVVVSSVDLHMPISGVERSN